MGQLFIKPLESLWWWDLKRVCGGSNEEKLFDKGSRWKIGIGDKARFWVDSWVDENCLANLFPRLYFISSKRRGWWCWKFRWRKKSFEWEREMLLQLTNLLENVRVHNVDLDLWIWLDSHSGAYSRNSAYVHQFQEVESEPLCNTLAETWRFKIPSKVAFLIWRVIRDRLLRKENLLKRGIMVEEWCCDE